MSDPRGGPGEFAELLRRFRERAALTQEELAEQATLTAKAIGALERGERRRPYPHTVRALADALDLDDADRAALSAAARPSAGTEQPAASTVPAPPTTLIGRDRERDEIVALLRDGTRLLTLTGPGGVGKTSLALDVARALASDFPDGVTVVELAPIREGPLVIPTVARALGVRQLADPLLDALAAHLGTRPVLVVLDNVEHVLDAAPDVAELLARSPCLTVLATSRAALRIRAEQELPLGPLPVPTAADPGSVARSPAAQVFLDRARAAGRAVALTDTTAPDVAAICRRLDGLPLALELAAAHARFLSPAALLTRLDHAVSSPHSRDLPERQRTIRATLDWSHDLLTLDEQVLFRRLAVFAGGFTLAAAEHVADGDVLPALEGLVEQSLVVADGERYRMLEPVRQYAAARLGEAGEAEAVSDGAAGFFLEMAAGARVGLRTARQVEWLDALQAEHGNLGATFGRLVDDGRSGEAARLGADVWLYWALRGNVAEGLGWLAHIDPADLGPRERAELRLALSGLRYAAGDIAGMVEPAHAAVGDARTAGADDLLVDAHLLAGAAAVFLGEYERADAELTELEALIAGPGLEFALALAEVIRGQLLIRTGQVGRAVAVLADAERRARRLASPFTLATVINVQAILLQVTGEDDAALERFVEGAVLSVEVGTTWTFVYSVLGLAVSAARHGLSELAAEFFAAGSATEQATSVTASFPPDLAEARRWLSIVRQELGEEAFRQAWERGRGLRPADVLGLAERITRGPA